MFDSWRIAVIAKSQSFDWQIALMIFIAYVVTDAIYAIYTLKVVQRRAVSAATSGLVIHLLLAIGVINYVENFLYVIPLALGSWFGTYFAIRWSKNKK